MVSFSFLGEGRVNFTKLIGLEPDDVMSNAASGDHSGRTALALDGECSGGGREDKKENDGFEGIFFHVLVLSKCEGRHVHW